MPHVVEDVQSQPDPIETVVAPVEATPIAPVAKDDPFDLTKLTLSQDFIETAGVKRLVLTVPTRKPSPQEFLRVHPKPRFPGSAGGD
jgi:hypothetical protein